MPKEDTDPIGNPAAWKPVEGQPGWLVLMDAPTFRNPRLIVSDQDAYFAQESARGFFPNDKLKVIQDAELKKRFLVRKVS